MAARLTNYDVSVFINCPFDKAYRPLLNAMVFTVYDCGFIPRSALEAEDQPQRLERIVEIVGNSRLSIHDLSRAGVDRQSRLARFNMPFELGLFLGAEKYGRGKHSKKSFTLFDKEPYRYQKFISDLNGYDPKAHHLRLENVIRNVRHFLQNQRYVDFMIPGPEAITERYRRFKKALPELAREAGHRHTELIYFDYCYLVQEWLSTIAP